jgi:hypothetical protein
MNHQYGRISRRNIRSVCTQPFHKVRIYKSMYNSKIINKIFPHPLLFPTKLHKSKINQKLLWPNTCNPLANVGDSSSYETM